jgi:hypothetical protein
MPEFKRGDDEMDAAGTDVTRATARLPGLDIEIVHRRAVEDDAGQIYIHIRAATSFEAFGRAFEASHPFVFWAHAAQLAWQPWLLAARALALPRPSGDGALHSTHERGSAGGALQLSPP